MPIYDQTYRRYEARGPLRALRFWPITREALRLVLVRRWFLALLAAAWLPFVVQVIRIYVVTRFPEANRILPVDGRLFGELLSWQAAFTMFVAIFGGAGLVANDLRTGAILVPLGGTARLGMSTGKRLAEFVNERELVARVYPDAEDQLAYRSDPDRVVGSNRTPGSRIGKTVGEASDLAFAVERDADLGHRHVPLLRCGRAGRQGQECQCNAPHLCNTGSSPPPEASTAG